MLIINNRIQKKISNIMCCPYCKDKLLLKPKKLICLNCQREYLIENGIYDFRADENIKEYHSKIFERKWASILKSVSNGIILEPDWYNIEDSEFIKKKINISNKSIIGLDGGCGTGLSGLPLVRDLNIDLICIDILPEALEVAKKNYDLMNLSDNVVFILCDILFLPFEDGSFDFVFSGGVIEHFYNPTKPLKSYRRVLKNNSYLICSVPNLFGGLKTLSSIKRFFMKNTHYEKGYTYKKIQPLFLNVGFNNIEIKYSGLRRFLYKLKMGKLFYVKSIQYLFLFFKENFPKIGFGYSWFFIYAKK